MIFNTVIHDISNANTSAFTYSTIIVGNSSATFTVNGVSVSLAPGTIMNLLVRSVSGSGDVYLLGSKINAREGSPTLTN